MDINVSEILSNRINEMKLDKVEKPQKDFSFTLKKLEGSGLSERLTSLIGDISEQGKILSEKMDIADLKKYRRLISDFMSEITSNSHSFSRENFLDKRGRHRVYGIVRTVNENLDKLAEELLKSEKDNLKILEQTDEIKGLLLDLYI